MRQRWYQASRTRASTGNPGLKHLLAVLIACSGLAASTRALAWGAEGHRLIAQLAEKQLSAAARVEIARLLSLESGATLQSVSTWADEVRSPSTAAWHYINFPRGGACDFAGAPLCIEGMCVVAAIERQAAVLDSSASDEVKLKALKYITHFVADVHQPLHAGYADDRGGNSFQVQAFGRGMNLHSVWDSGLIANWPGGSSMLLAAAAAEADAGTDAAAGNAGAAAARGSDGGVGAARWAEESCRIVGSGGFYPDGHKLDGSYTQAWTPVVVHQLAVAGRRLATLLNAALAK